MSDLLSIGYTGLRAYSKALSTVGDNIANAQTPGYARRRLALSEVPAGSNMVLYRGNVTPGGVDIKGVVRSVDQWLINDARISSGDSQRASAKLDWDEARTGRHAVILGVHRELVSLRRELPELSDPAMTSTTCTWDDTERWFLMRRGGIAVAVNFSDAEVRVELGRRHQLRWTTPAGAYLDAGSVVLPPHAAAVLLPVE